MVVPQHFAIMGQFTALHRLNGADTGFISDSSTGSADMITDAPKVPKSSSEPSTVDKGTSSNASGTTRNRVECIYTPVSEVDQLLSLQVRALMKCGDARYCVSCTGCNLVISMPIYQA